MMYNPQLETFIHVVDSGSFNKAAEGLYITPPAVIKQINSLEDGLGLKLFERTSRGLSVTEAGKSLYQDAKYVIRYCKDSVARAEKAMHQKEEIVRIGISPLTPAQILADIQPKIQKFHPSMKFQLVPFENTPENAREILANLGQNIDVVAGIFDETMLQLRKCKGQEIARIPIRCAVSIHHRLAGKKRLKLEDLYGENLMLMKRGWSKYVDMLREDLLENHPQITVTDFEFYDVEIFNQCENSDDILMAVDNWESVHPLLKILPVEWDYSIPFGILYAPEPSSVVKEFLKGLKKALDDNG